MSLINVVGGVRVSETAADLALLVAVLSSFRDKPLARDLIVFGEVGLSGRFALCLLAKSAFVKRPNTALSVP